MAHQLLQREQLIGVRLVEGDRESRAEGVNMGSDPGPLGDSLYRFPDDLVAALSPSDRGRSAIRDQIVVRGLPEAVPLGDQEQFLVLTGEWLDVYLSPFSSTRTVP
jgi:hypothetical protein